MALLKDTAIATIQGENGLQHSQQFYPLLKKLLTSQNLSLSEMDLFIVNTGPGGFTGLRVGIAVISALAYTLKKPLIGINSLDLIASQSGVLEKPVLVLLKATGHEFYCGVRAVSADFRVITIGKDIILDGAEVNGFLVNLPFEITSVFLGSAARDLYSQLTNLARCSVALAPADLTPYMVNWAASCSPAQQAKVQAYYLRPSDAEIKSNVFKS